MSKTLRSTRDAGHASRVLGIGHLQTPFRPLGLPHPSRKRILVLAAEPGDDLIGCGGVIQHALESGSQVQSVYLKDGATTVVRWDDRQDATDCRNDVARDVWQSLGGNPPILRVDSNGETEGADGAVRLIEKVTEDYRPDCIFVPFFLEEQANHRRVSSWLLRARLSRRFDSTEIWSYQVTTAICPLVAVDITDVEPQKHELVRRLTSLDTQFDYAHVTRGINAANSQAMHGLTGGRSSYFELFFVLPLGEYADLLEHYGDRC